MISSAFSSAQVDGIYKNYLKSVTNHSTFQYFLVVKVKNINTGQVREICTKGNLLRGALNKEYEPRKNKEAIPLIDSLIFNNKTRYFELQKEDALQNLGITKYSIEDLEKIKKELNFDSLAMSIKETRMWHDDLRDDNLAGTKMRMYAHALFNLGILTGEDNCSGGTIYYVDKENGVSPLKTKEIHNVSYKNWKKSNCNIINSKYSDNNKAKELLCQARYNLHIKNYHTAITNLKESYIETKSIRMKFDIIKMIRDAYTLNDNEKEASKWQARVDEIIKKNPDLNK